MATTNNVVQLPAIPSEVRERIVTAANALYEQAGFQSFPPVDQVRRLARSDMNAASAVMREWRREQTMRAAPVAVQIPEPVALANSQALASLWMHAQQLANESLQAAQAAWEVERAQLDALRQELATAHDGLSAELEEATSRAAATGQQHAAALQRADTELGDVRASLASALARADRAEARAGELDRRERELRSEIERERVAAEAEHQRATVEASALHTALEDVRAELAAVKTKAATTEQHHAEQRNQQAKATHQLAERMTRATAERDAALKEQAQARERTARLEGQVEALQQHNAELVRAFGGGKA